MPRGGIADGASDRSGPSEMEIDAGDSTAGCHIDGSACRNQTAVERTAAISVQLAHVAGRMAGFREVLARQQARRRRVRPGVTAGRRQSQRPAFVEEAHRGTRERRSGGGVGDDTRNHRTLGKHEIDPAGIAAGCDVHRRSLRRPARRRGARDARVHEVDIADRVPRLDEVLARHQTRHRIRPVVGCRRRTDRRVRPVDNQDADVAERQTGGCHRATDGGSGRQREVDARRVLTFHDVDRRAERNVHPHRVGHGRIQHRHVAARVRCANVVAPGVQKPREFVGQRAVGREQCDALRVVDGDRRPIQGVSGGGVSHRSADGPAFHEREVDARRSDTIDHADWRARGWRRTSRRTSIHEPSGSTPRRCPSHRRSRCRPRVAS